MRNSLAFEKHPTCWENVKPEDLISIIDQYICLYEKNISTEVVPVKMITYLLPLNAIFSKEKNEMVFLGQLLFRLNSNIHLYYKNKFVKSTIMELKLYHGIELTDCEVYAKKQTMFQSQRIVDVFDLEKEFFASIGKFIGVPFVLTESMKISDRNFQKLLESPPEHEKLQRRVKKLCEYAFLVWMKNNP